MTLKTTRLILRPWSESDASALYRLAHDPDVGLNAGWKPHASERESAEIIRDVLSKPEFFAIVMKLTGHIIGSIGLHPMENEPDGCLELGYWIGKPYWGCGFATEAARALLRYGFTELELGEIRCAHAPDNTRSRRVIEKCGFRYCETRVRKLRDAGERMALTYRLTREEWEAVP